MISSRLLRILLLSGLLGLLQAAVPSQATATCGDWLWHPESGAQEESVEPAGSEAPLPAGPCRGPRCEQSRLPTLPPVPVRSEAPPRQPGNLAEVLDGLQPDNLQGWLDRREPNPARIYPPRLERPPRG